MTITTQTPPQPIANAQTETASQHWLLTLIQIWGLVILTLHLAAPYLPEAWAWSVWSYTLLPGWVAWGLALLVGAFIIEPVNRTSWWVLAVLWQRGPGKGTPRLWFAALALLSGGLFWVARLRHLRWGDSYMLSVALSYPDLELRVIYNWQAPLTVFFHQRLWQFVADPLLDWPVETVYATTSIICGMLFVYVLLTFTARLGRDSLESGVLAGLVATTGSMQLFFGYVENYTLISLGLLLTMFAAWLALRGEIQPVWPVIALSLTNALHPSTTFIWPGMWLLVWLYWRRGFVSFGSGLLQLALPPLLAAGGVLALMESGGHGLSAFFGVDRPGGGDSVWFVPLFELDPEWARYQHYTMFSVAHFLDWGNIHLLISPFGLPLILICLTTLRLFDVSSLFETTAERDYGLFLGLSAAMYILLTWLWNPDYGGRKDWDLFAPSAFVYTLLAGYLLVRVCQHRAVLKESSLFVIAVSLLHTGAWIFANTHHLPRE